MELSRDHMEYLRASSFAAAGGSPAEKIRSVIENILRNIKQLVLLRALSLVKFISTLGPYGNRRKLAGFLPLRIHKHQVNALRAHRQLRHVINDHRAQWGHGFSQIFFCQHLFLAVQEEQRQPPLSKHAEPSGQPDLPSLDCGAQRFRNDSRACARRHLLVADTNVRGEPFDFVFPCVFPIVPPTDYLLITSNMASRFSMGVQAWML